MNSIDVKAKVNSKLAWPAWPHFAEDEIAAVNEVLHSGKVNYWTGQQVKTFEKEFADYLGVKHAVAVANGTLALELALHALDIGPGDEVIVPSCTFIATASAVVACGAKPIVVDVEYPSQNMSVATLKPHLTKNTKAIIAVHLAGYPCDMPALVTFAQQHNLKLIEDCAQAHGAQINNQYVGSFGDIAAFSFCQDKIMTTGGEGGIVVTNNTNLYQTAWSYKDHGKDFDMVFNAKPQTGYRWLHTAFGTNWRMTEMQAAIGRKQLAKLPEWHAKRHHNAKLLDDALQQLPQLITVKPADNYQHAYYKYYVFLNTKYFEVLPDKQEIINKINAQGVPCFSGVCPEIYLEKAFSGEYQSRYDNAKLIADTSLMFLVHPTLTEQHIQKMIEVISAVLIPYRHPAA